MGQASSKDNSSILNKYSISKPSDLPDNIIWTIDRISALEYRLKNDEAYMNMPPFPEAEYFKEMRPMLSSKYVFAYNCLRHLLRRAIEVEKYRVKLQLLRREMDDEKEKSPTIAHELEHRLRNAEMTYNEFVANWDHGKFAYEWLLQEYLLCLQMTKVHEKIHHLFDKRGEDITSDLKKLRQEEEDIAVKWNQHEKEALSVGLAFLDSKRRGGVTPKDLPDISANIFLKLDLNKDQKISPSDLQSALSQMSQKSDDIWLEQARLQREKAELGIKYEQLLQAHKDKDDDHARFKLEEAKVNVERKAEELAKTHVAYLNHRDEFQQAFEVFRESFIQNVFGSLQIGVDDVQTSLKQAKAEMGDFGITN